MAENWWRMAAYHNTLLQQQQGGEEGSGSGGSGTTDSNSEQKAIVNKIYLICTNKIIDQKLANDMRNIKFIGTKRKTHNWRKNEKNRISPF